MVHMGVGVPCVWRGRGACAGLGSCVCWGMWLRLKPPGAPAVVQHGGGGGGGGVRPAHRGRSARQDGPPGGQEAAQEARNRGWMGARSTWAWTGLLRAAVPRQGVVRCLSRWPIQGCLE